MSPAEASAGFQRRLHAKRWQPVPHRLPASCHPWGAQRRGGRRSCRPAAGYAPVPVLLQAARLARTPGRAEGVLLAPVPGSDRHDHLQLGTAVVWWWGNLNVHVVKELAGFAEEHQDWLQIFQLPSCAPELNPAERIWSLLKRHLADFAAADLPHLTRVVEVVEGPRRAGTGTPHSSDSNPSGTRPAVSAKPDARGRPRAWQAARTSPSGRSPGR
ncbi:transposase [Streptomyces sp. NPDC006385]|uniref:transposase n=1 Tax=Streptomyces sp. NPDC006385 TaxID=3156761 RepID=UPI0033A0CF34